jgi:hypothetical protein
VSTYTVTETGARELAGKVASDLREFSLHYGHPGLSTIPDYIEELEALLRHGYAATYVFGFRRNAVWVVAYEYAVNRGQLVGGRPGGIEPNVDVSGSTYLNFLTYSESWGRLSTAAQEVFYATLKIKRTFGDEPSYSGGVWMDSRVYGAGGTELQRRLFKR